VACCLERWCAVGEGCREGLGPAHLQPSPPRAGSLQAALSRQASDPGEERCLAHRRSLRAYLGLLFLRWPRGFALRLRGAAVPHASLRGWLRWPAKEEYRPRGIR
jgi:hypothetical protein